MAKGFTQIPGIAFDEKGKMQDTHDYGQNVLCPHRVKRYINRFQKKKNGGKDK